jgi:hypothetical protein
MVLRLRKGPLYYLPEMNNMKRSVLLISIYLLLCIISIAQTPPPGIFNIGLNESLGGYVFYLTPDGKHGLVAATQDQSSLSDWYLAQDLISIPDNHDSIGKKFTDWRLPTKYELNLMYTQKTAIASFANDYYWSSIANAGTSAWLKNFGDGRQDYGTKDGAYHIRAVRSF